MTPVPQPAASSARDVIASRWPTLHHRLQRASPLADVCMAESTPFPCRIVQGIHLSSAYDPEREAMLQATLVASSSRQAWLYGIGGGTLPRELLRRPALETLHVVCFNLSLARELLSEEAQRDWLEDSRVQLHYAADLDRVHAPFAVSPACLRLADRSCLRLRDQVLLELSTPFINTLFAERREHIQHQIEANHQAMTVDPDIGRLFASRPGATCVVVGAGPTLARQYPWMRRYRERFTLLAVDASLAPLAEQDIIPDLAVAIDSHEMMMRFFTPLPLERYRHVALIYFPQVYSGVVSCWPGPRFCAWPVHSAFEELYPLPPRSRLFSGGSVIHPATDLAVQLGAATIIFAGADFALPGRRSHVAGCAVSHYNVQGARDEIPDGHGRMVATVPGLRGFLRDMERFIQRHDTIRFLNSSREGAHIHGTRYLEENFWHEN